MAYIAKTNWTGNENILETDVNRWEQGIKDAHDLVAGALKAGVTAVTGSPNVNTLTDPKYYSVGSTATNIPTAAAYLIMNTPKTAAGAFYQYAYNLATNAVHTRLFNGSTFSSWGQQETTAGAAAKVKAVTDQKGTANGIAALDANGNIITSQIGPLRWRDVMGLSEGGL